MLVSVSASGADLAAIRGGEKQKNSELGCQGVLLALSRLSGITRYLQPPEQTITSVSISPATVNLQVTQTQQFNAEVKGTGNYDTSVQWFVNGTSGGSTTVGTIVGGLYTAPAQPPNPVTVTVKAVASGDPTKFAAASATIRPVEAPTIVWNETELSPPGGNDGVGTEGPPGIALADDGI